jgi:uncharacterized protein (DUF1330 family)
MKKGYWVVRAHISDPEEYSKYVSLAGDIVKKHNGTFLIRGGDQTEVEGEGLERTVLVEFHHMIQLMNAITQMNISKL